ncbi:MAG: hypothetical protein PVS2B2_14700 [Candidatus Acidiferrum sp.]
MGRTRSFDAEKKGTRGGLLRFVTLLISILLGLVPLAGIGWIMATRTITTVEGMFMSLILITLSGIFFLNVFLELRERGFLAFLQKNKAIPQKEPPASKAS